MSLPSDSLPIRVVVSSVLGRGVPRRVVFVNRVYGVHYSLQVPLRATVFPSGNRGQHYLPHILALPDVLAEHAFHERHQHLEINKRKCQSRMGNQSTECGGWEILTVAVSAGDANSVSILLEILAISFGSGWSLVR